MKTSTSVLPGALISQRVSFISIITSWDRLFRSARVNVVVEEQTPEGPQTRSTGGQSGAPKRRILYSHQATVPRPS